MHWNKLQENAVLHDTPDGFAPAFPFPFVFLSHGANDWQKTETMNITNQVEQMTEREESIHDWLTLSFARRRRRRQSGALKLDETEIHGISPHAAAAAAERSEAFKRSQVSLATF